MNIQKLALLALISGISCGIIASEQQRASSPQRELPPALDRKKFNNDTACLSTALEDILIYFSDRQYAIDSKENREILLQNFKGSWERKTHYGALKYTFDSYMERAGINSQWMEQWYREDQSKKNDKVVTLGAFTLVAWKRLNDQLEKYTSEEKK